MTKHALGAAAPELLEALKQAVELVERFDSYEENIKLAWYQLAKKAIAKLEAK